GGRLPPPRAAGDVGAVPPRGQPRTARQPLPLRRLPEDDGGAPQAVAIRLPTEPSEVMRWRRNDGNRPARANAAPSWPSSSAPRPPLLALRAAAPWCLQQRPR